MISVNIKANADQFDKFLALVREDFPYFNAHQNFHDGVDWQIFMLLDKVCEKDLRSQYLK